MAFDAFLKIDGVPGESTDSSHKDWIEILSFSHGLFQQSSGSMSSGGGAGAERCDHSPFTIVKQLDKASPLIALKCCSGEHIKNVTVSLNRAGGDKVQYMEYKLTDVLITSYQPGGSAGGSSSLPVEEVAFTYGKVEWTYTQQKLADGTGGGKVAAGWDLKSNKKV
ncbi:MAG: type VI secretion system tube protein Hcp [Planctomycetes bacterium]|nr:type VI secretion system tube protein Hcp [Planctomycetota bacterium]